MLLIYKQHLRMAVQTTTNVYQWNVLQWKHRWIFFFINFYQRREWKVSESTMKKQLEIKKKKQLQQFSSRICILWILKSKKLKTEARNLWDVKHIPEIFIKESFGFI